MSKQSIKAKDRPQDSPESAVKPESEVKAPPETFYGKADLFMEGVWGFIAEIS